MVPNDALRAERFIWGLANPMFITLSSYVRRITYVKAIDAALQIEDGIMERRALKEATKKPNVRGSFSRGLISGKRLSH